MEGFDKDKYEKFIKDEDDDEDPTSDNDAGDPGHTVTKKPRKNQMQEEEEYFNTPRIPKNITVYYSCDKMTNLYVLNQAKVVKDKRKGDGPRNCSK